MRRKHLRAWLSRAVAWRNPRQNAAWDYFYIVLPRPRVSKKTIKSWAPLHFCGILLILALSSERPRFSSEESTQFPNVLMRCELTAESRAWRLLWRVISWSSSRFLDPEVTLKEALSLKASQSICLPLWNTTVSFQHVPVDEKEERRGPMGRPKSLSPIETDGEGGQSRPYIASHSVEFQEYSQLSANLIIYRFWTSEGIDDMSRNSDTFQQYQLKIAKSCHYISTKQLTSLGVPLF
jgi:hypothetical protein